MSGPAPAGTAREGRPGLRLAALVVVVAGLAVAGWATGLHEWVRPANLARLRRAAGEAGAWAPVLYVAGYVVAELAFVPAIPLTLLAGVLFGTAWGTVFASLGSTLAAAAAFLVARHLAREPVARWIARSPRLARLDAALAQHGWRVLVVTRVVPLFPFNVQNFAYGLTRIRFGTYVLVSWAAMLPGTVALTMAGGALSDGRGLGRALWTLAIAGTLVVVVSLVPAWLARRTAAARAVLPADPARRP